MSRFFRTKSGKKKTKLSSKRKENEANSSSNETNFSSKRKIPNRDPTPITLHLMDARNLGSTEDPSLFCILYLGKQKFKSEIKKSTKTPNWDQTFVFNYNWVTPLIRVDFFDLNSYLVDERVGYANIDLEMLDLATKLTAWFPIQKLNGEIQVSVSIGDFSKQKKKTENTNTEKLSEKKIEKTNNIKSENFNNSTSRTRRLENKPLNLDLSKIKSHPNSSISRKTRSNSTNTRLSDDQQNDNSNKNSNHQIYSQLNLSPKIRRSSESRIRNESSTINQDINELLNFNKQFNNQSQQKSSDEITKLLNQTNPINSNLSRSNNLEEDPLFRDLFAKKNSTSNSSSTRQLSNIQEKKSTEDLLSSTQSLLQSLQINQSQYSNTTTTNTNNNIINNNNNNNTSFNIDDYLNSNILNNTTTKTTTNLNQNNNQFNSGFIKYNNNNNTTTTTTLNNNNTTNLRNNQTNNNYNNSYNNTNNSTQSRTTTSYNTNTLSNTNNSGESFGLEFVYGYTGDDRNNVHFTSTGEITYYASAVGIVYNAQTHEQRFFKSHSDTISCNAIHPNKEIVATGQINAGNVYVWDIINCNQICEINPPHDKGISCLAFSHHQPFLVTVGLDSKHTVCLWNWKTGRLIMKKEGPGNKVLCAHFDPTDGSAFVICGIKHIQFWKIQKNQSLSCYPGTFQGREDSMLLSLAITNDGMVLTGNRSGDIYCWGKSDKMVTSKFRAHVGPCVVLNAINNDCFLSGGKDGKVNLWSTNSFSKIKQISSIVAGPIRAIDLYNDRIVAGSLKNQIWLANSQTGKAHMEIFSHSEEVHGLACHPFRKEFISTSDDRSVNVWSLNGNKSIGRIPVNGQPRIATFSPDGKIIGIGLRDGEFKLCNSGSLKQITNRKNATCEILQMKFSPNSSRLAICHEDGVIYCYGASTNYRKISRFKLPGIISLDWSNDSSAIRVSTLQQTTCWNVTDSRKVSENSMQWETNDRILAKNISNIRRCDVKNGMLIKADESSNSIQVVPYPNNQNKDPVFLLGHGSKVLDVKFLLNSHIISAGGKDHSVFLWKKI
ncbi:echinoderm microtubule-associated protein-like elp-1 [Anaeramoeba flamelloides]|uniref:Echinoderm microtubule-associated protein-like elp-1 n=1 Tax=Anaeramoeba flamelloides TaxID=1746091 RepID=A0AAV7Z731_9EUKA|nr:echinoderm microtubule-associated protein-like elp-1 [Anaeramoeba flamelloides]